MRLARSFRFVTPLAVTLSAGMAGARDTLRPVHFPPGQSAATIHQSLVRGDSDIYQLIAKAGQAADIRVTSAEDNADLMIYQPPSQIKHGEDGLDVDGKLLPGGDAVPGLDAGATRHWSGSLPATGSYYIVVVGSRGNVTYDLKISIK